MFRLYPPQTWTPLAVAASRCSAMLRRCALRGVSAGGVHGCARRLCATRAHAGIFVDAENLQGFLKRGGASRLVEDALPNPTVTGSPQPYPDQALPSPTRLCPTLP